MQHIAVCDLAVCTFWVIPRMIALISDQWILGDHLCRIQPYITYYFGTVCLFLTCLMAVCKLSILKFPIRPRYLQVKASKSHQLCALVWVASMIVPAIYLDRVDIFFDFRTYSCESSMSHNTSFLFIAATINLLAPIVIIVVCAVFTVKHLLKARRVARRSGGVPIRRRQGIVPTTIGAVVFTVAVSPFTFYCFTLSLGYISDSSDETFLQGHFYRFATSIILLNMLTNFFFNGLPVTRFRNFMFSPVNRIRSLFFTSNKEAPQNAFR